MVVIFCSNWRENKNASASIRRFVEAQDPKAAEMAAVQIVREDSTLQQVLNDPSDSPMIYAEEIIEATRQNSESPNTGYTFYNEENKL
ncbi:hypothetical protein [Candidatus Nitrospira salsa]